MAVIYRDMERFAKILNLQKIHCVTIKPSFDRTIEHAN